MSASITRATHSETTHNTWLQRAEGVALFIAAIVLFYLRGGNWLLFALLLFAPDLSAFGYLFHSRYAALAYNLAHILVLPALLAGLGYLTGNTLLISLALIWATHIGMDRMVGYGLKETTVSHKAYKERV